MPGAGVYNFRESGRGGRGSIKMSAKSQLDGKNEVDFDESRLDGEWKVHPSPFSKDQRTA